MSKMPATATIGGEKLHWVGGMYVEADALRIAEKVNDFDPNLRVQYLEEAAAIGDPPFRVVESCRDGVDRTVLYAWQLDDRVIERLYAADTQRRDILLAIDKQNAEVRKQEVQRYQEKLQEAADITASIIRSDKETYKLKDGDRLIKIHHSKPAEVVE